MPVLARRVLAALRHAAPRSCCRFWRPTSSRRSCSRTSPASPGASPRARRARAARDVARGAGQGRKEPSSMSRARTNKENRPKRPSTLGLLLGGHGRAQGRLEGRGGRAAEAPPGARPLERDGRLRRLRRHVQGRHRQVMPGMFSPDGRVLRHQLPVRAQGGARDGLHRDELAVQLLPGGLPRAAPGRERAHPRRRGRPQGLLRARGARHLRGSPKSTTGSSTTRCARASRTSCATAT